mmetsp:Transcript_32071/g.59231  ORF Transcript_32071/g.59231 Transcript_32071/m.59231 type:complete len:1221 (+) Transcript_32071:86-3748(+)
MFGTGSSFASSLPSSDAPASSGGGKRSAFGSSTSTAPSSLPFAGFGGGGFGATASSGSKRGSSLSGNASNKLSSSAASGGGGGFSPLRPSASSQASQAAATGGATMTSSNTSFGANMFAAGGGGGIPKKPSTLTPKMGTASAGLPFAGFGGFSGAAGGMSPPKSSSTGGSSNGKRGMSSFSGAASSAAAAATAAAASSSHHTALVTVPAPAPRTAAASSASTSTGGNNTNITRFHRNNNISVENSCMSPDGRSFHSYLYDSSLEQHVIVSDFAPFGDASSSGAPQNNSKEDSSSLKITTVLPATIVESINIDPIIGLICVDGSDHDDGTKSKRQRQRRDDDGGTAMSTLPWMCLYTPTSVFLLSVGYHQLDDDEDDYNQQQGKIVHVHEPFEKQLLMSPRGSSILRVRAAPSCDSMFQRCGSMALLLREGGGGEEDENVVGHVLLLYHGLPESILGSSGTSRVGVGKRDFGGRNNPTSEGSVTIPLRFDREDLVRGMEDTVDAENEAYHSSSLRDLPPSSSSLTASKRVADFCFLRPNVSTSGAGGLFAAASIFVLCSDGSVYGASPILFDGTVLPRSVVVNAISHLDGEIEASTSFMRSMALTSPAPTLEQEQLEARLRQCRAARRYVLDAFGIPEGMIVPQDNNQQVAAATPSRRPAVQQGSYYVSASVVHSRSYSSTADDDGRFSRALAWQPRLQGPLIVPSDSASPLPPCLCIESFGSAAGAGIIDGFVVARDCKGDSRSHTSSKSSSPIHVEFGILPGEGAVILPRFEFESDVDCQLIDELVRGTGMYVERASIMNDKSSAEEDLGGTSPSRALSVSASSSIGRDCCIVVDPLDDIMIHVLTRSRIVTVTTNAVAVTANCFKSRAVGEAASVRKRGNNQGMSSIRTKVWSGLEVNSSDAALVGARVSGDVHLGHILLARVSNGPMEVVNITATQCLHETSEQMKAKSEQLDAFDGDQKALEILKRVQPLPELLQPLIDKVCNGLSKMGKIVGGATLPKDAGPENLAVFLDTQHSCEVNVLMPMEEMSKILTARRDLLKEMYNHQAAELVRLSALLDEFKQKYESNLKRVLELESNALVLAERSSAVLTATRELRPQITDAEAAYFKDIQRYESTCNKWEGTVNELRTDATTSCDAMSAGAIEHGDVRCLVDLPPQKIEMCHKLLHGEGQILKELERKVKESTVVVERLSKTISGLDSLDAARLRLIGGDKENQRS